MSVYLQRNQFGKHLILLVFFIKEKKAAKVVISKKIKHLSFSGMPLNTYPKMTIAKRTMLS